MEFSRCVDDSSFGPVVNRCRDNFDFTLKFELLFFSIIPASIFIGLSIPRLAYLAPKRVLVTGSWFLAIKLVSAQSTGLPYSLMFTNLMCTGCHCLIRRSSCFPSDFQHRLGSFSAVKSLHLVRGPHPGCRCLHRHPFLSRALPIAAPFHPTERVSLHLHSPAHRTMSNIVALCFIEARCHLHQDIHCGGLDRSCHVCPRIPSEDLLASKRHQRMRT